MSTPRPQRWILIAAVPCGVLALVLSGLGLWQAAEFHAVEDAAVRGHGVARWLYDMAGLLTFEPPDGAPENLAFSLALVLTVLFAFLGALGIVLELYRPASDGLLRGWFWCLRAVAGRPAAVVIGLGWIGEPLARELRRRGRPVYAIALDAGAQRAAEARRNGVLVVEGDAADGAVRARVPHARAAEVFIATGDDTGNVQIAGELLADLERRSTLRGAGHGAAGSGGERIRWYIHASDPALSATLRGHGLLRRRSKRVDFRMFSLPELSAQDLFFNERSGLLRPERLPGESEVFHLFIFGFGPTGQAAALHLARFGHFRSGLRPRLTVYGTVGPGADRGAWQGFLERHPAFSPPDLDLASEAFLAAGDAWAARPGRPAAAEYRSPQTVTKRAGEATAMVTPIEYAVNAEFLPLPAEIESGRLLAEVETRLRPAHGPPVRAAAVFCFEEVRRSFQAGLRFQGALAHRFLDDEPARAASEPAPSLPIHVHLPVEAGLDTLVAGRAGAAPSPEPAAGSGAGSAAASVAGDDDPERAVERCFPMHVFGRRADVGCHDAITRGTVRERATAIRAAHEILSGRPGGSHPDFDESDLDAVLHAEAVKCTALGIRFVADPVLDEAEARGRAVMPGYLLASLCSHEADEKQRAFERGVRVHEADGKLRIPSERFRALDPALRRRLALLDRIHVPRRPEDRPEAEAEARERGALSELVRAALEEVIRDFAAELVERGRDADLAAEMEHNRWMGERLAKGWRYGPRSDMRRQRDTFIPWAELTEEERHYDRVHLPRLIVQHSLPPRCAYAYVARPAAELEGPDTGPAAGPPVAAGATESPGAKATEPSGTGAAESPDDR